VQRAAASLSPVIEEGPQAEGGKPKTGEMPHLQHGATLPRENSDGDGGVEITDKRHAGLCNIVQDTVLWEPLPIFLNCEGRYRAAVVLGCIVRKTGGDGTRIPR
jgi:hypothetical protein